MIKAALPVCSDICRFMLSGFLKVPRYDRISSLDMSLNDFLCAKNLDSVKRSLIISFLEVYEILDSLLAAIM
jgi:hypothetical protein